MQGKVDVMIYGADGRIGSRLVRLLVDKGVLFVGRASDYFSDREDIARAVAEDIHDKKPAAVVNCLLDHSTGQRPAKDMFRYVSPVCAMVQQCRRHGIRFVHCSSSRIYGQVEQRVGRPIYSEYDPPLCDSVDLWRPILHAAEFTICQQTAIFNSAAIASIKPGFAAYILRFGHVFDSRPAMAYTYDAYPPDECIRLVLGGHKSLMCGDPSALMSPVTASQAAEAVFTACDKSQHVSQGTYNVASPDYVSVARLMDYAAQRAGKAVSVGPRPVTAGGPVPVIDGVDTNQALDVSYWEARSDMKMKPWYKVVDEVLGRHAVMQAIL